MTLSLALSAALVGGGVLLLYFGADWLVKGSAILGVRMRVPSILVGLTVVSLGTSAPELVVSVLATLRGSGDLAVGGVLGSNLANVGLILGLAAVIRPLEVSAPVIRRDIPWMLGVTLLLFPLMLNGWVGRFDAALLLTVLVAYLYFLFGAARRHRAAFPRVPGVPWTVGGGGGGATPGGQEGALAAGAQGSGQGGARAAGAQGGGQGGGQGDARAAGARGSGQGDARAAAGGAGRPGLLRPLLGIGAGALALMAGGQGVVTGATDLAAALGISELVIGLSLVAVGTSLPELATSIVATARGEADLAVGNIVGSNLFNVAFVLGGAALAAPIAILPRVLTIEYPVVLALSLVLLPLALTQRRVGRIEGVLLLFIYAGAWVWIMSA